MDVITASGSPTDVASKPSLDSIVRAAVGSTMNPGGQSESPAGDDGETADSSAVAHDDSAVTAPDAGKTDGHEPSIKAASSGSDPAPAADAATLDATKVWPREQQGRFAKLSDEAKRFVLEREKMANVAFTKNATENADHRKFGETVRSLFTEQTRASMRANGIDEATAIKRVLGFHDRLTKDPISALRGLITQLGIKPEQLGQAAPAAAAAAEDDEFVDPRTKQLESKLSTIERVLLGAFEQQQQQTISSYEQEFEAFAAEKDEAGNPKHPHLEAVFDQMLHLVKTDPQLVAMPATQGRAKLEKAYEQAVYYNPDVRKLVIEGDYARRTAGDTAAAAAAKAKAASTRKGSPGANGATVAAGKQTLDQIVRAAVKGAHG